MPPDLQMVLVVRHRQQTHCHRYLLDSVSIAHYFSIETNKEYINFTVIEDSLCIHLKAFSAFHSLFDRLLKVVNVNNIICVRHSMLSLYSFIQNSYIKINVKLVFIFAFF
jgi:hypothetical protein